MSNVTRLTFLFSVIIIIGPVYSGKILGLFPTPLPSHQAAYGPLMLELARRGHRVTTMTTHPALDHNEPNLNQIDVGFSEKTFRDGFNLVEMRSSSSVDVLRHFYKVSMEYMGEQLRSPEMKRLLDDPDTKFDVCFVEIGGIPLVAVKDRFECSLVLISSFTGWMNNFEAMGSPWNPVAYNSIFSVDIAPRTFSQRLTAAYEAIVYFYYRYYELSSQCDAFAKEHFGELKRSVDEIEADADMLFLNVNPVLGEIRPTTPTVVYMGSVHVEPSKPLPKSYQSLLDKSTNGVIYLSFGSNARSIDLPKEKREAFLEAFKNIPYTVLWKWENDTLPEKPDNVHIFKWLPQNDILAHPNIKLFITQGGQQSFEEALSHKVPYIVMPFVGDQVLTKNKVVALGMGLGLDVETLSSETIRFTIEEVISNPRYRENVARMAVLINDQPQTPLERAVWWTEYLLRHGNTKHLKAPSIPFYQYYLLDMIGLILGIILIVLISVFYLFSTIKQRISKNSKSVKSKLKSKISIMKKSQ